MSGPLEGYRIVELAGYVAAPAATRVLADLGAEVIKVEAFSGDPYRTNAPVYHMPNDSDIEDPCFDLVAVNKKFIALNLKNEKAKEVFNNLLSKSDVLVTNTREQSLERLGYSYSQVKEAFPHLIYAHMVGYGLKGSKSETPGYDYTCFAARGGVTASLYEKGGAPMIPGPAFGDLQASMVMVAGILAALINREKTGKGDRVVTSLHGTAVYNVGLLHSASQFGYIYPISRKEAFNPFNNTYKTSDDHWVQLCIPNFNGDFDRVMKAIGREDLCGDERYCNISRLCESGLLSEFVSIMDAQLSQRTVDEWRTIFKENDIPYERCLTSLEVLDDPECWSNGFLRNVTYPTGLECIAVNSPIQMDSMGEPPYRTSRGIGADTEEILQKLGYSVDEISGFEQENIALQHE